MKLSSLGELQIAVVPMSDNPEIMAVDVIAENRKEKLSMKTNKDETVDQFTTRIKSMLRAMLNAEQRDVDTVAVPDDGKSLTFAEQKAALKVKK